MKRTFEIKTSTQAHELSLIVSSLLYANKSGCYIVVMDDKEWKASQKRSNPMNAMFHAWMVEISKAWNFHNQEGDPMISPEGFKEYFKGMFLGQEHILTPEGVVMRTKRTRDLSKQEFTIFLNDIENYVRSEMSDYGINLDRGV